MNRKNKEIATIFKALGDENRIAILTLLKHGERCICTIIEDMKISQSTLSHHMKILSDVALVQSRKEGKWTHYSINKKKYVEAIIILKELSSIDKIEDCSSKVI